MRVRLGDYIKEYSVKNKNNEDIPVYSVSNSLGFCKDYFGKEVASKNKTTYKIVPRGCFAYNPSRINVGSVDWQNEEERVIVSPLYNVFSVSPLLDQQYLLYYLKSNVTLSRIRAVASGSVRDNLKLSMLYEFPIDLISLDQQYDVVSTLNAVQKIIDLYQKGLSYLDELVRARFVEMFSDNHNELIRLADVCTKITDGTHKTPNYLSEGITFISAKNIVKNKLDFSDVKYISKDEYQEIQKRCQTEFNDILLSKSGSLGTPVIVKTDKKLGLFESLAVLKYDRSKLVPEFLCEQLKSEEIQRQFKVGVKGVAIKHLHLGVIGNVKIIVPPLELQNQFASFVEEIDKSRLLNICLKSLVESVLKIRIFSEYKKSS